MERVRLWGRAWLAVAMAAVLMAGCGPITAQRTRVEFEPYSEKEVKQTRSGITIEQHNLKDMPPEFIASVQQCDANTHRLSVDAMGRPAMEQVLALPKGSMLEKLSITNNTGHVVRLNSAVIATFDPADNQYNTLDKQEITAYLQQQRPCISTSQLAGQLNLIKLIDHNTELLPNRTTSGYMVYMPRDSTIPGVWKLTLYELPVQTNAAGAVTETVNFEFKSVCKKYEDTYQGQNLLAPMVKVSSKEIK